MLQRTEFEKKGNYQINNHSILTAIPRSVRNAIINRAENAGKIGCQHVQDVAC